MSHTRRQIVYPFPRDSCKTTEKGMRNGETSAAEGLKTKKDCRYINDSPDRGDVT